MQTTDTIDLTRSEAEQASILHGKVTAVDRVTNLLDVEIDELEYIGISAHYHCKVDSAVNGHKSFKIDDVVLILNKKPNDPLVVENLTIIGFADGYPRPCMERFILFSVPDENPSTKYSANTYVLWSVDAGEIAMGPCSLLDLQTAGFIDSLVPLVLRGSGIPDGGLLIQHTELPSFDAHASVSNGTIPDNDDLDEDLIWDETTVGGYGSPDYSHSDSGTAGPVTVDDVRCYNDLSQRELNSNGAAAIVWEYTTQDIENFILGWAPQPDYFIKTYAFQFDSAGMTERAVCLTPLYFLDEELSEPGLPVPKAWGGAFVITHAESISSISTTGNTRWINSGSFFTSSTGERLRTVIETSETNVNQKYYSPIGLLLEKDLHSSTDRTTVTVGTNDPVITAAAVAGESINNAEVFAFSAKTVAERIKADGEIIYEQIACAVYLLKGFLVSTVNGVSGSEPLQPEINVSIDVFTDVPAFNPFNSANIPELAAALKQSLMNSGGGETIGTTFFKGEIP